MSEKLCTLRGAGGGGGRYKETSLWTNSAPTSSFADTTITLSQSIDNFKYICIRTRYGTTPTDPTSDDIYPVEDLKKSVTTAINHVNATIGVRNSSGVMYARLVFYISDTSLRINNNYRLNTSETANGVNIPLEILGLNELAHGTKYTTNASEIAFKSVSANTIPTFTTVAEAKAIWLTINYASAYRALQITNVNPTTGEINNDSLYKIDTNSLGNIEPLTGNKFIVTSNSVTMQNAPSTAATQQSLIYTY